METNRGCYHGYRFPPQIISHAVWLYHRFCLSFRDVEELLAEHGIVVSYETIRQWCRKFGPLYARTLRRMVSRSQLKVGDPGSLVINSPFSSGQPAPGPRGGLSGSRGA
ncbi:hypothetical protein ACFL3S_10350, partial [Gemmatimonadota bacterium]